LHSTDPVSLEARHVHDDITSTYKVKNCFRQVPLVGDGKGFHQELTHSAESIDAWLADMLELAHGKPIAIMLEQSRGPLVYALMFRKNVLLYPVNPKQLVRYRESFPGGGKDDPTDARYLARMLRERITTLKAWQSTQNLLWFIRLWACNCPLHCLIGILSLTTSPQFGQQRTDAFEVR